MEVKILSWDDIISSVNIVANKIVESGYNANVVIGVLRGGITPALLLADILGIEDVGVIDIKLYQAPGVRGKPYLKQLLTLSIRDKTTLIVDDVSDTGLTLQSILDIIRYYAPKEVRTATLYIKPWTRLIPDYYAEVTDKWLVFPWGIWEYKRFREGAMENDFA